MYIALRVRRIVRDEIILGLLWTGTAFWYSIDARRCAVVHWVSAAKVADRRTFRRNRLTSGNLNGWRVVWKKKKKNKRRTTGLATKSLPIIRELKNNGLLFLFLFSWADTKSFWLHSRQERVKQTKMKTHAPKVYREWDLLFERWTTEDKGNENENEKKI